MGHPDQPYVNVRVQSAAFPRLATGNSTNKKNCLTFDTSSFVLYIQNGYLCARLFLR